MKGKNHYRLSLMAILFLFVFVHSSLAGGNLKTSPLVLKVGKGKKMSVIIEKGSFSNSIEIRNPEGAAKLQRAIDVTTSPFLQIFNVETWPLGIYEIIIRSRDKKVVQPIEITENDLTVLNEARKEYFVPIIAHQKSKSIKIYMNNNKKEDIEVSIINERGSTIFKKVYRNKLQFKQRYDLRKLRKSVYLVKVTTNKKAFYRHIRI